MRCSKRTPDPAWAWLERGSRSFSVPGGAGKRRAGPPEKRREGPPGKRRAGPREAEGGAPGKRRAGPRGKRREVLQGGAGQGARVVGRRAGVLGQLPCRYFTNRRCHTTVDVRSDAGEACPGASGSVRAKRPLTWALSQEEKKQGTQLTN